MKRKLAVLLFLLISVYVWSDRTSDARQLQRFWEARGKIIGMYVDTVNEDKMTENAIIGMLENLDPHSVYINRDEKAKANEPLVGNFEGIGVQFIMLKDTLHVEAVIPGGPSERVGLLAGDRIVMVDDSIIAGVKMSSVDVMKRLRGKKGTAVTVRVKRSGQRELLTFRIVRDKIPLYSVAASFMVSPTVGYIKLVRFSETTYEEFKQAMRKLQREGMTDLVFDLESNGGGYLNQAIDIADDFIDENTNVLITKGRHISKTYSASHGGMFTKGRIVFLVDGSTASAAEILAGSMQDLDRAVIVGRRTFGKGLVQQPIPLSDGAEMRLTVARYYIPSGRCIQRPYKEGLQKYKQDAIDRYNRGELTSADSIHFPDSLKYKTLKMGRIVYGGGGIMPDYYVPIDTSETSVYLSKLIGGGILQSYSAQIVDKNEKIWKSKYPLVSDFLRDFVIPDDILKGLVEAGEQEELKYDEYSFLRSRRLIENNLKSLFARRLYGEEGFYRVHNEYSEIYQKAIELLATSGAYEQIFQKGIETKNSK